MQKIKITLNSNWVLEHKGDDTLPHAFLLEVAKRQFAEAIEEEESTFTRITFRVLGENTDPHPIA